MAAIKADEITKILRAQIENYESKISVDEIGTVISLGDGIARVHGLDKVMAGELISFPHDVAGIAMNLEEDQVGAVLLGDYTEIKEGDEVKRTGRIMSVPVGDAMTKVRSTPNNSFRWSASLRASSIANRCASPWPRASRPSTA